MSNKKHYYVLYLKSPFSDKTIGQLFCIVEDEDIAKDYCQKHPGFNYYEDTVEKDEGEQ